MNRGAVGVVDDGGEEGVLGWLETQNDAEKLLNSVTTEQLYIKEHLNYHRTPTGKRGEGIEACNSAIPPLDGIISLIFYTLLL